MPSFAPSALANDAMSTCEKVLHVPVGFLQVSCGKKALTTR